MSARGKKRHCLACGTKYYDLNRTPVICPKCKTPDGVTKVKKAAVAKPAPEEDEDVDDVTDLDEDVTDLDDDVDSDIDDDILEDASDLGEDDDDLGEVYEHVETNDDDR